MTEAAKNARARARRRIAACSLGALAALGAAETFLRACAPIPDPYGEAKERRDEGFVRSAHSPLERFETTAEPGLPGVSGKARFTTNEHGFRGEPIVSPKPPGELRIFVVGGSAAECLVLDDSQALTRVLEVRLRELFPGRAISVQGAGKSGARSEDHVEIVSRRIVRLQPDVVVVFCGVNDLVGHANDEVRRRAGIAPTGSVSSWKLAATTLQLGRRAQALLKRASSSELDELSEIPLETRYRRSAEFRKSLPVAGEAPAVDRGDHRENLRALAGIARKHGFSLVFVTQPATWGTDDRALADWQWMLARPDGFQHDASRMAAGLEELNDEMRRVAGELPLPVHDLARLLPGSARFFYDDCHLNVEGARAAGSGLADFLKERGIVK